MSLTNLGNLATLLDVFDDLKKSQSVFNLSEFVNTSKNFIDGMGIDDAIKGLRQLGVSGDDLVDTLIKMGFSVDDISSSMGTWGTVGKKSLSSIGTAIKGFFISPLGKVVIAIAAVTAAIALLDFAITTPAESIEKMNESFSEFEDAQKEVADVNSELETTRQRIEELETKESLTFVEQEELDKLREANDLLLIQQDLAEKKAYREGKEAAADAESSYNKNFRYDSGTSQTNSYISDIKNGKYVTGDLTNGSRGISGMIAALRVLEEFRDKYKNDSENKAFFANFSGQVEDVTDSIWEQAELLTDYKSKLEAIPESYLTDSQKQTLAEITETIEYIYQELDPAAWKQMQFDKIFDNETFANAKTELIGIANEMSFVGVTVDDVKAKFPDLAAAVESAGFTVEDLVNNINSEAGVLDADAVRNQIKAAFNSDTFEKDGYASKWAAESWFADWINNLSNEDLEIVYDIYCNTDTAEWSLSEWKAAVEGYKEEALTSIETIKSASTEALTDTNDLISGISGIQEALSSQSTGKSLSLDDYNSEELKEYASALEYTNGALQLNADKVNELIKAKAEEQIAINDTNKAVVQSKYLENAAEIERLRRELGELDESETSARDTIQSKIDTLLEENGVLKDTCTQYDLMSSSLREATSAYQNWLNAQNAAQSGDMFDDTIAAFNHINDTLNNKDSDLYGRVGRTDYEAAVNLVIPDSIDPEDSKAVNAYMKEIYSLFTYDDDGNYAGLNIKNFCKRAVGEGLMVLDEATNSYQIVGQQTMEDFAEGMGLSLPLVQAMFGEMEEFGAEFSWADEAHQSFGDLAVSANEAAEALRGFEGNEDLEIRLDVSDIESGQEKLDTLDLTIAEMNTIKAKPNVDPSEVEYANEVIKYCVAQKQLLSQPDVMMVDTSVVEGDLGNAIALLQEFQAAKNNLEVAQALGIDTTQAQADLDAAAQKIQNLDANITSEKALNIDTTSIDTITTSISNLSAELIVKAGVDETAVIGYQAAEHDAQGTVIWDNDTKLVDVYAEAAHYAEGTVIWYNNTNLVKTKFYANGYVNWNQVNGTAHASGTARAGGDWGTAPGGKTLVGELGQEIVVDPHTGRWYTVGDTGAEFRDIPRGAIVFNHKQSESLLKNGYVAGRASALVGGTAMVTGGIPVSGADASTVSGGNNTSNYTKGNSNNSHDTEDELEVFDWIEVAIDRIERAVDRLKTTATSAYKALKTKLGATYDEISNVNEEIAVQGLAYERYMEEANSVGLSSDLASKVQDGTIDLTEYDSETQELIKDYQEWYEKALDCSDAIQQLHEDLASLYEDNFNNIKDDFDSQLELLEHMTTTYETGIDKLEAQGYLQSTEYYAALKDVEQQNIDVLNQELASLIHSFSEAMASGEIEEGSEAWYNMQIAINDVKEQIDEAELSLAEYAQTMREIEWEHFDYTRERIAQLTQESDFMIELMSNSDMHTDNGQLTDEGMATMGLHGLNYNTYMAEADAYAQEILEIDKQLAEDPYNTELIERREELLGLQQDSILAAEAEKQAIIDLVREGIELELASLKELIDGYTDALDSAKDLYEYQKKIKEHTQEIASIQKQLSAYENDYSEETQAKVQQLRVLLEEAESNLEETEYTQYIADQKKLLDELYLEYETVLNERLDNTEALLEEMIGTVNANADSINTTLIEVTDGVGYTMTESMQSIWNGSTEALDGIISTYGDDFGEKMTAANNVLSQIEANTAAMVANSDEQAEETVEDTTPTTDPDPDVTAPTTPTEPEPSTPTEPAPQEKTITIGGKINAKGAKIYDYAGDKSGENQYFSKDPIYTVLDEKSGYLKVRHHKLSSGVTGWFKKSDVKAYKTGGLVDYTGLAQLDGTPGKPELVLNAQDTANFIALKETLQRMSEQGLSFGTSYGSAYVQSLSGITDISKKIASIRDASGINTGVNIGDTQITIEIDHVEDYNDFVAQLQKDKQFERFVQSMTVDRLVGGTSLKKNKYFGNR